MFDPVSIGNTSQILFYWNVFTFPAIWQGNYLIKHKILYCRTSLENDNYSFQIKDSCISEENWVESSNCFSIELTVPIVFQLSWKFQLFFNWVESSNCFSIELKVTIVFQLSWKLQLFFNWVWHDFHAYSTEISPSRQYHLF